jgi:hypothetical protein
VDEHEQRDDGDGGDDEDQRWQLAEVCWHWTGSGEGGREQGREAFALLASRGDDGDG